MTAPNLREAQSAENSLLEISGRIREMREVIGYSTSEMAARTDLTEAMYIAYESGASDLPFTFMHKCALAFGVELTELLEGHSAKLSNYTVTRKGKAPVTAEEDGILIQNLAPMFRQKLAAPYWVTYKYFEEQQNQPIHTTTHAGQEFDLVLKGTLKVQVGDHTEVLHEGDSIFYKSSTPHGMIAVNGSECLFLAVIMAGNAQETSDFLTPRTPSAQGSFICEKFIRADENENGTPVALHVEHADDFNFAFDIVDALARREPDKTAMVHVAEDMTERVFTFKDIKDASSQAANYFLSLGIKRGDRVMLSLKRNYQFWFAMLGLHKLGAIAIPVVSQLVQHDFEYRFRAAGVSAVVCTADGDTAHQIDLALAAMEQPVKKILAGGAREGWHDFDSEYVLFSRRFLRKEDSPKGNDPMMMFFTSGTTGYPKIVMHTYKYPLGHYVTAKYWHWVERNGLHFTISDTGWGKALWGKLYGQWMCECAIFVYDFARFDAEKILPMFQ
ncbi:MAG: AMP-binding protein, partial [Eubacteriales bacterium]|nr:AMP-binding protein [Eubacteriales bacterium]